MAINRKQVNLRPTISISSILHSPHDLSIVSCPVDNDLRQWQCQGEIVSVLWLLLISYFFLLLCWSILEKHSISGPIGGGRDGTVSRRLWHLWPLCLPSNPPPPPIIPYLERLPFHFTSFRHVTKTITPSRRTLTHPLPYTVPYRTVPISTLVIL